MKQLPFDIILSEALKLDNKRAEAKNEEEKDKYRELFLAYLDGAGWSEKEFDKALLGRVSSSWEEKKQKKNLDLN